MKEAPSDTIRLIRFERDKPANLSMNVMAPEPLKREDIVSVEFCGQEAHVFKGERARIFEARIRELMKQI